MRILLDHCVPRRFGRLIPGHDAVTARRMGWDELRNGALLTAAEVEGFTVLLTVDKNLRYQQSLGGRRIAIVNPRRALHHPSRTVAAATRVG